MLLGKSSGTNGLASVWLWWPYLVHLSSNTCTWQEKLLHCFSSTVVDIQYICLWVEVVEVASSALFFDEARTLERLLQDLNPCSAPTKEEDVLVDGCLLSVQRASRPPLGNTSADLWDVGDWGRRALRSRVRVVLWSTSSSTECKWAW